MMETFQTYMQDPQGSTDRITAALAKRALPRVEPPPVQGYEAMFNPNVMASMEQPDQLAALKQAEASGNPNALALHKKVVLQAGNDPVAQDEAKQFIINHPDSIDPGNAYQVHTTLAQWQRQRTMPSPQQIYMQASGAGKDYFTTKQEAEKHISTLDTADALQQKYSTGGGGNSVFATVMEQINSDPQLSQLPMIEKIRLAQNKVGTNLSIDPNTGRVVDMTGAAEGLGNLEYGKNYGGTSGTNAADLIGKPDVEAAVKAAELGTQKAFDAPKALSRVKMTLAKSQNVINKIDSASSKVNGLSAGYGALWQKWPSSAARDLAADLNTIKANLGFDELNEMRQNSPTGGALGQVAVQEIEFLQSVVSNLEQSQSPEQLRANLAEVRKAKMESDARIQTAYEADFGRFTGGGETATPSGNRIKYDAQGNRVQ